MLRMYVNLAQYKDVFINYLYLEYWIYFSLVILASSSSLFVVSCNGIGETHYEQIQGLEEINHEPNG
jgi:hypothetical protein